MSSHSIKRIKYHLNYDKETTDFDVAVIELKDPIEFRPNARPICLPESSDNSDFVGRKGTVIGWGKLTEYGLPSRVLHQVSVSIISNAQCQKSYKDYDVSGNMLCAGNFLV